MSERHYLTTEQHWTGDLGQHFVLFHCMGRAGKLSLTVILEGLCTISSSQSIFALAGWGFAQAHGDLGWPLQKTQQLIQTCMPTASAVAV